MMSNDEFVKESILKEKFYKNSILPLTENIKFPCSLKNKKTKQLSLLSTLVNKNRRKDSINETRTNSNFSLSDLTNINMEKIIDDRISDLDEVSDFDLEEDKKDLNNDSFDSLFGGEEEDNNKIEKEEIKLISKSKNHQDKIAKKINNDLDFDFELEKELNEIALELLNKKYTIKNNKTKNFDKK